LPNREVYFHQEDDILEAEEIAFGAWWELTPNDAKKVFKLLKLDKYIKYAPLKRAMRYDFEREDINWQEVFRYI